MNKLTYKNAAYCCIRHFFWAMLVAISAHYTAIVMWKFLTVLLSLSGVLACSFNFSDLEYIDRPFDFPIAYIILGVIPVFVGVEFALDRNFFKKYKHFFIKPKFEKVPLSLSVFLTAGYCVYSLLFAMLPEVKRHHPYIEGGEFLIFIYVVFFVLKYIIEKNSVDIVVRNENE